MKYRCKVCMNMIEEIDIHDHVFTWHEDAILERVWSDHFYVLDKFVDYDTGEES